MRLNLATADPIGHAVDTGTKLFNTIEASRQRDIDNSRQAALDRRQTKIDERQEEEWQLRKAETELRTNMLKKQILNEENAAELNAITLALQKGIPFNSLPPERQERGRKLIAEFYQSIPGAPSSPDEIGQRRATWDYMSKIGNSFEAGPQQQPANGPLAQPAPQGMNQVQQAVNGAMGGVGGKQLQPPIKITDPTLITPLNGTVDPSRLAGQYKDEKGVYYTRGVSSAVFDPNRNAFTVMLKAVRPGAGPDGSDEVFEVPVTEGRTNTPNDPIKWITIDKLKEQATGHQQLFALGDYTGFNQLPAEEQLKYFAAARAKLDPQSAREEIKARDAESRQLAVTAKSRKLITDVMAALPADAEVPDVTRALVSKGVDPKEASAIASALVKAPREPKMEWRGVKGKPNYEQAYKDGKAVPDSEGGMRLRWQPHAPSGGGGGRGGRSGGDSSRITEKESRADIDKSLAYYHKEAADYDKRLREAKASGDRELYADLQAERDVLTQQSKAITAKMAQHQQDFGRAYTPTTVPAGMGNAPVAAVNPVQRPVATQQGVQKAPFSAEQIQAELNRRKQAAAGQSRPSMSVQPAKPTAPAQYNFFNDVNSKFAKEQAAIRANALRDKVAATRPNDWVTAVDRSGRTYRTQARNAVFNTQTSRWEIK